MHSLTKCIQSNVTLRFQSYVRQNIYDIKILGKLKHFLIAITYIIVSSTNLHQQR